MGEFTRKSNSPIVLSSPSGYVTITGKPIDAATAGAYQQNAVTTTWARASGSTSGPKPTTGINWTNNRPFAAPAEEEKPTDSSSLEKLLAWASAMLGGSGSGGSGGGGGTTPTGITPTVSNAGGSSGLPILFVIGGLGLIGYWYYQKQKG